MMKLDLITNVVYILLFFNIFALLIVFKEKKIETRGICFVIGFELLIGLAFRTLDQGLNDTKDVYLGMYELISNMDWNQIFQSDVCKMTSSLFVTILKLCSSLFFNNFRCLIMLFAFLFIDSFERLICYYSDDAFMANLYFIAFFYPYGFFLMRQCLSMSFIAYSLCAMKSKKKKTAIVLLTLSGFIHSIAWLFILFLFIAYFFKKLIRDNIGLIKTVSTIVTVIIAFIPSTFLFLLDYLPENSKYKILLLNNVYAVGDIWLAPLIMTAIQIFIFWYFFKSQKNSYSVSCSMTSSFVAMIFTATTGIVQDMIRISYYFNILCLILAGNIQNKRTTRRDNRYYRIFSILLILYAFFVTLPNSNIIRWS